MSRLQVVADLQIGEVLVSFKRQLIVSLGVDALDALLDDPAGARAELKAAGAQAATCPYEITDRR